MMQGGHDNTYMQMYEQYKSLRHSLVVWFKFTQFYLATHYHKQGAAYHDIIMVVCYSGAHEQPSK